MTLSAESHTSVLLINLDREAYYDILKSMGFFYPFPNAQDQ